VTVRDPRAEHWLGFFVILGLSMFATGFLVWLLFQFA
jgi:hypothetical protein